MTLSQWLFGAPSPSIKCPFEPPSAHCLRACLSLSFRVFCFAPTPKCPPQRRASGSLARIWARRSRAKPARDCVRQLFGLLQRKITKVATVQKVALLLFFSFAPSQLNKLLLAGPKRSQNWPLSNLLATLVSSLDRAPNERACCQPSRNLINWPPHRATLLRRNPLFCSLLLVGHTNGLFARSVVAPDCL